MMDDSRYTANDIKIGLLVTVSAVLLTALIAVTSDIGKYFREKRTVSVLFKNVVGLQANSPVNYSGVEVGRVKSVSVVTLDRQLVSRIPPVPPELIYELPLSDREITEQLRRIKDPARFDQAAREAIIGRDMVLLQLEVDAENVDVLHEDDYVSVESNLMGDTSVEISPGSGEAVSPGRVILGRSGSLFSRIGDAVDEIRYLLRTAGAALGSEGADLGEVYDKIHQSADNFLGAARDFRKASEKVFNIIDQTEDDVVVLAKKARSVSEKADNILGSIEGQADPLMGDVSAAARELRSALEVMRPKGEKLINTANSIGAKVDGISGNVGEIVSRVLQAIEEGRADIRRSTLNVRDATKNLEEFTALVKKKPWLLLRAPRGVDRELEDSLSHARMLLESSTRLLEAAEKLAASTGSADEKTARMLMQASENLMKTAGDVRREAREIIESLRPLPLKNEGRGFEPERRPADVLP